MLMNPPDISKINDELDKTRQIAISIEKKLFARKQELLIYKKPFQKDMKYRCLYGLSACHNKKLNYWLNFSGEFGEEG